MNKIIYGSNPLSTQMKRIKDIVRAHHTQMKEERKR